MKRSNRLYRLKLILGLALLFLPLLGTAGPWLDPGNQRLRHDLQLLADAGIIHIPIQSWPVQAADVDLAINRLSIANLDSPALQRALSRVQRIVRREARGGRWRTHVSTGLAVNPEPVRSFNASQREDTEVELGAQWMGGRFASRIQGQWLHEPEDEREWRLDGSYLAAIIGNWAVSIDTMENWWGPGWDGSLFLSNNARPFPKVTLQRNYSEPADTPVLSWLGPWRWISFLGELDNQRQQRGAKLFGARFASTPVTSLQWGLSSVAMFGGGKRTENLESLLDVYSGHEDEQGNSSGYQVSGADLRWRVPFVPLAVYGQYALQSEQGGLGDEDMLLYGAETWFSFGSLGHSVRIQLEHADLADSNGSPSYSSEVYTDGYTFYGEAVGHTLGRGSGELTAATITFVNPNGSSIYLRGRNGQTGSERKTQLADYKELQVGYEYRLLDGSCWSVDLGWRDFTNGTKDDSDGNWYGAFLIRRNF